MIIQQYYKKSTLLCALLLISLSAGAADQFAKDAPKRLVEYLGVDTVNPPGNEINGAKFFAKYLKQAGIKYYIEESAPGRANIWAKISGGNKPGIVLLNHMDVVPANKKYWGTDPYKGVVKDDFIFGRGALDMKGLGISQFQAFLSIAASKQKLNRDLWFVATADEEAGGLFGAGWLIKQHPEIFENVGFLINEGGSGIKSGNNVTFSVEVTQKVPLWLRLKSTGRPGHGSRPQVETSVTRLLKAGHRITSMNFKARALEPVKKMFASIASEQTDAFKDQYANIADHIDDTEFMMKLQLANPSHHSLLRDTCSATRMEGSSKINVVPAEVMLELDCRLLPDQNLDLFQQQLALIIADPNIEIERIMGFSAASSGTDTRLFQQIKSTTAKLYPGSRIVPTVMTGFTDSHFFRDLGITSYGFSPFVDKPVNYGGIHGNNEKISIENMINGTALTTELLRSFTTD